MDEEYFCISCQRFFLFPIFQVQVLSLKVSTHVGVVFFPTLHVRVAAVKAAPKYIVFILWACYDRDLFCLQSRKSACQEQGRHRDSKFRQKIIPRKTKETEQMFCSGGILAVPQNRKLSEFRSEPFLGREKCSVQLDKNRSKVSEFHSEPFRGRENNSKFCSAEQK